MSRPRNKAESARRTPGPRYGRIAATAIAGAALVTVIGLLLSQNAPTSDAASVSAVDAYESSGTASAAGVEVDGSNVALGQVPLDVTVVPTWTLTNTSGESVDLGEPHASVIEGCCPGPLQLEAATLAPGESTRLSFPLQMHAGMDGPHDFDVHVPVGTGGDYLTLDVTGHFGASS